MNKLNNYLPSVFQDGKLENEVFRTFDLFLFDHGVDASDDNSSLSDSIASMSNLYNPEKTPPACLKWLGQWVALSEKLNLDEGILRLLIKNANYIHAYSGTRKGLLDVLDIVLNSQDVNARTAIEKSEQFSRDFILSVVGDKSLEIKLKDSMGEFSFDVVFSFQDKSEESYVRKRELVKSIINMIKPAYAKVNYSD